jgi:hypothetical protein
MECIVRPIAANFTIPYQIGRGQDSTSPIYKIARRFKTSGKEKLIVLALSDLDPDGDAITHSIGQRLRDDHNIRNVEVVKAALTMKEVRELNLPEKFERAKVKSPNYKRYVQTYRSNFVWELEAVPPKVLQGLLIKHIDGVIDRKAFNAEVAQERKDAAQNVAVRNIMLSTLREQINTNPS